MHIGVSRHGIPFLLTSSIIFLLTLVITLDWTGWARYAVILCGFGLLGLFLVFFRDPERVPPDDGDYILAPADGRIIRIADETDEAFPEKRILISIFMSLWNVHVNRFPISGKVMKKDYKKGEFLPAFTNEAPRRNEQCSIIIENNGKSVLLRQISGILARRIITYPEEGDQVTRGERLGMILFGSRLDLLLPPGCEVRVSHGERTIAGQTIMGVL
jgi:phosphatidylserine decarboxylase